MTDHLTGDFALATSPQGARIREATMAIVVEHGFDDATVAMVAARADLSTADFERHFADLRECCMQVYLANIAEFDRIVFAAVDRQQGWRDRLRASAYAAQRYVRDRPLEARFNLIQMLAVSEMAQAFRDRYVERIIDLIDAGRQELEDPESASRDLAAGIFGSVYEILVKQLHDDGDIGRIDRFVPELMYIAVRPYLGHEVALEELSIPPPPEPGQEGG